MREAKPELPKKGWWNRKDLTAAEFCEVIVSMNDVEFPREMFDFTHEIYEVEDVVAEAANLDYAFRKIPLGVVSVAGGPGIYCMIPGRYKIRRKRYNA